MPLSKPQRQALENWMHSKAIVQCRTWGCVVAIRLRLLPQGTPGAGRIGHVRGEGGSEGHLRQLRIPDALGRPHSRHQGFMGRREGALEALQLLISSRKRTEICTRRRKASS
jgi:hypothetical protein